MLQGDPDTLQHGALQVQERLAAQRFWVYELVPSRPERRKRFPIQRSSDRGPENTGADCAAFVGKWALIHAFAPGGRPIGNAVAD